MIPTANELTLLRTRPQSTRLWLSIYEPPVVLACSCATSHGRDVSYIDYDTVTEGSYTSVEGGMTLYIGTTPGGDEIGKLRVRGADANQIHVAENSDIDWTAGYYLTIVRFWEINAVFPRIIQDPADETNTIWYKDYDLPYLPSYDSLGTLICMGSHYAGFIVTGSCGIYYTASGSTNVNGDSVTYSWWFQGATVTGSSAFTPGFIQYDTPGHYTTKLLVTTPTGTFDRSYRHISIYERPDEGSNTPILRWNMKSFSGDRDSGGYTAKVSVYENFSSVKDGALCVIFADDYYGTTKYSMGNAENRGSIVFVGYIMDGSITVDYDNSALEFTVGSPTEIMKQVESFAIGVNSSSSPALEPSINPNIPSGWATVKDMTVLKAMYHYLKWHSSVLKTNDFQFVGNDKNIQYFDADRESIYSAIKTLLDGAIVGELVSDRSGKVWAEESASATNNAATAFPFNMSLEKYDWMGTARITEVQNKKVSYLEMGGIYYPGPGFDSTPLLACAPGVTPAYRGTVERLSGLALLNQSGLNIKVGNVFAWKNARYPSVQLNLTGNYRNLDIAPINIVQLTMNSADNIRGISWNRKAFVMRGMGFKYDAEKEILNSTIDLHEVTQGLTGETISIPPVPPTTGPGGGFSIPTIEIPSIPSFPISIEFTGGQTYEPQFVLPMLVDPSGGDWLTRGYWSSFPAGLTIGTSENKRAVGFFKVPFGYVGTLTITTWFSVGSPSAGGSVYHGVAAEMYCWKDNSTYATEILNDNGGSGSGGYKYLALAPTSGVYFYQGVSDTLQVSSSYATRDCFVRVYLYRNGLHASDTFNADIYAAGWTIDYA